MLSIILCILLIISILVNLIPQNIDKFPSWLYNICWDIAQFFAYHFGKRTKVYCPDLNKNGYTITNHFNNTTWFIPNDKSFKWGNFRVEALE